MDHQGGAHHTDTNGDQWVPNGKMSQNTRVTFRYFLKQEEINFGGFLNCEQVLKRVKRCSNIPIKTQQPSEYGSCSLLMRIKSRIEDFNMVPRLDVNYVAKKRISIFKNCSQTLFVVKFDVAFPIC